MRRFFEALAAAVPTLLVVLGAVTAAVGVGMIYLPAGVIAGGALAAVAGVVMIRGGGDDK